jgi:hypothetical protein
MFILGNGPSIHSFSKTRIYDEQTNMGGCNFPLPMFSLNQIKFTLFSDIKAIRYVIGQNQKIDVPIVITEKIRKYLNQDLGIKDCKNNSFTHNIRIVDVQKDVIISSISKQHEPNSGQYAVMHAIEKYNARHIHLAGFDSFWTGNTISNTDKILLPSSKHNRDNMNFIANLWNQYWCWIWNEYSHIQFTIYVPYESFMNIKNYNANAENVKFVDFLTTAPTTTKTITA